MAFHAQPAKRFDADVDATTLVIASLGAVHVLQVHVHATNTVMEVIHGFRDTIFHSVAYGVGDGEMRTAGVDLHHVLLSAHRAVPG
jgi:hypothetical protein